MDDGKTDFEEADICEPDEDLASFPRTTRTIVADGEKGRFDSWLAKRCAPELSRSRLQALLAEGRVLIDGIVATSKSKPLPGQRIEIHLPCPEPAEPQPENIPLDILYEDADLIVLNKQAGLVVHPAAGHSSGTLVNAILFHCKELRGVGDTIRPGIVHRLDKDTTGVMVVAKNETSMDALSAEFKNGETRKVYLALVHNVPSALSGSVTSTIGRDPNDRKRMAANPPHGKPAISHWKLQQRFRDTALLRVRIETGRTHQIRVHLASIGLPIVGDPVYGSRKSDRKIPDCPARQMLHAVEFAFTHPTDKRPMCFQAPLPSDMKSLLERLQQEQNGSSHCREGDD